MAEIPAAKQFSKGDRVYVQAQQVWLILAAHVMQAPRRVARPPLITYGEVAERMGMDRRAGHTLGRQLGIVANFCISNNLPPLNVIVVNQTSHMPGDDVIYRKSRKIPDEQRAVYDFDWFSVRIPTTGTFRKVWEAMK